MAKPLLLALPAVLLLAFDLCAALECYHCYSGKKLDLKDANFVPCNEANLTLSNVWVCPHPNAKCTHSTVEIQYSKEVQTWRTCSNGLSDPCDPNVLPPGVRMIECSHCSTDRCNLQKKEKDNQTFTFNINANVNLFVRNLN